MSRRRFGLIAALRRSPAGRKEALEVLPVKPDRMFVEIVQEESKAESREVVAKTKRRGRKTFSYSSRVSSL
jgi:hypothetical protein